MDDYVVSIILISVDITKGPSKNDITTYLPIFGLRPSPPRHPTIIINFSNLADPSFPPRAKKGLRDKGGGSRAQIEQRITVFKMLLVEEKFAVLTYF